MPTLNRTVTRLCVMCLYPSGAMIRRSWFGRAFFDRTLLPC